MSPPQSRRRAGGQPRDVACGRPKPGRARVRDPDPRPNAGRLALAFAVAAAFGCNTPRPGEVADRLDALFAGLHARGEFDGAVVVGRGERILFARGYGLANAEEGVAFTPDTPVDGASLAKTFTAALVLLVERDGLLRLDEPAQRLLPELPYPEITIRHLLTHTSGLPAYYESFDRWLPPDRVRTTETLLAVLAAHPPPLAFPPGTRFEYSSFAYDLAALAAARAADTTVDALFRERLFGPLGLRSAFLRPARLDAFPAPRTRGYRRVNGRLEPNDVFDFEAFHGGSNVYLSARDLQRWSASIPALEPVTIGEGRSGLTLANWYRAPDGSAYWYPGHLQGFHDVVFRDARTGVSIVYVSNNTLEPWLHHALIRAVRQVLAGEPVEPLDVPPVSAIAPGERPSLAGRWMLDDGTSLTVEHDGDTLFVRAGGLRYLAVQVTPNSFYVPGLDDVFGFARDGAGAPSRIRLSTILAAMWGTKAPERR